MMQKQDHKRGHQHHHSGSALSGLNVAGLRKRLAEAAAGSVEEIKRAEEEIKAAKLSKEAEAAALHELKHIADAQAQKAPIRKCLRRVKPQDRRLMHGGCGGI